MPQGTLAMGAVSLTGKNPGDSLAVAKKCRGPKAVPYTSVRRCAAAIAGRVGVA